MRIRCTYFAEGYAAVLHPDELLAWHAAGHEIAVHGWKHEMWTGIASRDEEERLIQLAVSSIRGLTGQTPAGFRPPGLGVNPRTDEVLAAHGIRYVSRALSGATDEAIASGVTATSPARVVVLPTDPALIDGAVIHPRFGGIFGTLDAAAGYDRLYRQPSRTKPRVPKSPGCWSCIRSRPGTGPGSVSRISCGVLSPTSGVALCAGEMPRRSR